jgi:hypothetical protein
VNIITGPVVYGLAAVAIAASIFAGVQTVRLSNAKAKHATTIADIATKTRIAAEKARAVERTWTDNLHLIDVRYQQDLNNAQAAYDTTVADLRSGAASLQDHWTCPPANMPRAASGAGQPDGQADLRAAGAGHLVQAGATCDAWIIGLQKVTQSDRQKGPLP